MLPVLGYGKRQLPLAEQSNRRQERPPADSDQPARQCQQPPPLQRVRPPTESTTTGNLNTNHDKYYMRMQEDFLAIAAPTPAGAQAQEVSSPKSPSSKIPCPSDTVNSNKQVPPDAAISSQEQASDDSSDWSITPDRVQKALERANLPALGCMQKAYEDKVAALEDKLTPAKAHLQHILQRQQTLKASETRVPHLEAVD